MSQQQNSTFSGSVYDTYSNESSDFKEERMPRIGQVAKFEDGREFIFCSTEVDLLAGVMVRSQFSKTFVLPVPAKKGSYEVSITMAGITANELALGQVSIGGAFANKTGGTYKIKSNTASNPSDLVVLTLYDPIWIDTVTSGSGSVTLYRPKNVLVGTLTGDTVGAALVTTDAVSSVDNPGTRYQWIQYAGIGQVKLPGPSAYGDMLYVINSSGEVGQDVSVALPITGRKHIGQLVGNVRNSYAPIWLTCHGG